MADQTRGMSDHSTNGALAHEPDSALSAPRLRRAGRPTVRGDREALKQLIRDIPNFLRLLGSLARDARVAAVDKGILLATIGYIVMPMDLIPDFIPFLGQVDDIYLLALALDRLLHNASVDVLLEHWRGERSSLELAISGLDRAASFLPERIRDLLHQKIG